ncbi:MAG: response regulator [Bacteroidota bacterium]|jgi:DNA-binding NarL/FixJ family response regulator
MQKVPIRIVMADDHAVFRAGLRSFLGKFTDFKVVGEANNGEDLVELVQTLSPDIIITDIDMPRRNGIDAAGAICKHNPSSRILILSVHASEHHITNMVDAGALGYVLKSADAEEIIEAIHTLFQYKPYFCKVSTEKLTHIITKQVKGIHKEPVQLSGREKEIIQLICEEYTSKAIAYTLHLSKRTVEGHRTRIMDKIGAKSVAGIITYAIEHGIYVRNMTD